MLGEGFDLPNLKVAALHARHRSLAVTLQFIGRFARTSTDATLGTATFFAIPDELEREAQALYVPGAEWNEIVETLSRDRIESERQARDFVQTFARTDTSGQTDAGAEDDEPSDDDAWRLLRTLRPYFHVKVYDALTAPCLDAQLDVPDGLEPLVTRHSKQHNALIWVGRERQIVRWSTHEGWVDVKHEMFLLVHIPDQRLLFVCSSCRESSVYDRLVSSVLGDKHRRLATSEVNRVLRGISAPEFFSLGMRNRAGAGGGGAESYRMLAGRAADRAVRAADSAVYDQGHGFCRGEEDGTNVTIGFSSGSKVWANRRDGLNQFVAWMHQIAAKLRMSDAFVTGSGIDKLNAARRVERYESPIIYGDLPPDAYVRGDIRVLCDGASVWLVDLAVRVDSQSAEEVDFALTAPKIELPFKLTLTTTPLVTARSDSSKKATLSGDTSVREETLTEYLNEHPIALYLENLARVDGIEQHDPPQRTHGEPIAKQIVAIDWAAAGVDPYTEKPSGRSEKRSLFEYVEERLLRTNAQVVFLDDGAGEIADYISIEEEPTCTLVQLFHCKAATAGHSVPNQRIASLYEVAGQAVKCRRFLDARRLTEQLEHRRGLKGSAFKRGDMQVVRKMLADPSRISFQVIVVQPALSTEPSAASVHLLEAADAYMRGADQLPLVFWGSEPITTSQPPKAL